MQTKRFKILFFSICFVVKVTAQNQIASIDSLNKHVYFLASDSLKGRETGQEGQKLAANYIATAFSNYGLKPISDRSYFHFYDLQRDHRNYVVVKSQGSILFWPWHYFYVSNYNHSDTLTTHLVFAGYGTETELKSLDVQGKAIAFISNNPADAYQTILQIRSEFKNNTFFVIFPKKNREIEMAWSANYYLADFQLPDDYSKNDLRRIIEPWATAKKADSLNIYYCFPNVLRNLFLMTDSELQDVSNNNKKQNNNLLHVIIQPEINCYVNYSDSLETIKVENVGGYIWGKDTTQTIIISAHFDHLGQDMGRIYYGADDNASGTAALLENARLAMCDFNMGIKPERNILFLAFSGEELGLYGSKAFVQSPFFDRKKTVLNINMDMIGRWDERHRMNRDFVYLLTAGKHSKFLMRIGKRHIKLPDEFTISSRPGLREKTIFRFGSDHYNFLTKDIPVAVFFTGLHEDYHTPHDTPDKINYKNLTNISTVVYRYIYQVAHNKKKYPLNR